MKVLLAPTNYAGQPIALMHELRAQGVDAQHLLLNWQGAKSFHYDTDLVVNLGRDNWVDTQIRVMREIIDEGFDIIHFFPALPAARPQSLHLPDRV